MKRERTKDDLGTPAHILARVRQSLPYMRIALDPCSNAWTRETVGASRYCDIDEGTDGLLASWHEHDLGGRSRARSSTTDLTRTGSRTRSRTSAR
jgi:hypothetical protein